MMKDTYERADVAILGGGPAGMQAALVVSRTGKNVVVFDDPGPPRNGASHGVHNFLGVEGLLPREVREHVWKEIGTYGSAVLREERIVDVSHSPDGGFRVSGNDGAKLDVRKVILAVGYHDRYPDVPGFVDCWGDTIIPCPFCDGYENRGRVWGIVPGSLNELQKFPTLARNWTSRIHMFLQPGLEIEKSYREQLSALDIGIHEGRIERVVHSQSKVQGVVVDGADPVGVETLLWVPAVEPSPLIAILASNLEMELDEGGYPKTDEAQRTSVDGLWAAGDVLGWAGGVEAAAAGYRAATDLVRGWYG